MNAELLYTFNIFLNTVITLVLLFLIVHKKAYAKKIILFIVFILVAQLVSFFLSFQATPILTLALLTLLFQVLTKPTQSKNIDTNQIVIQAKEHERSRIYANLHDDVGAKLLELIYSSESDKTKNLAKEVLSDIRQAVASTMNIQCNNQQLAEEISQEIQARIRSLTIEFIYHSDITSKQKLAANVPSVLSRIMREATSNIIKHAQATQVSLSISSTNKKLSLVLEDNGRGFETDKKNGKGLKTIQKRAGSINAEVNWEQLPTQGTKFTLIYPYGNE